MKLSSTSIIIGVPVAIVGLAIIALFSFALTRAFWPTEDEIRYQLKSAIGSSDSKQIMSLVEKYPWLLKEKLNGFSLLHLAAGEGDVELTEFLLKNGMDPNIREPDFHNTPLMKCCRFGEDTPEQDKAKYLEVAKILIKGGANVNALSDGGVSALLLASRRTDVPFVKFLVDNGADLAIPCHLQDGRMGNVYDLAIQNRNQAVADYLKPLMKPQSPAPATPVPPEKDSKTPGQK